MDALLSTRASYTIGGYSIIYANAIHNITLSIRAKWWCTTHISYLTGPQGPLYICSARLKLTLTFSLVEPYVKRQTWHYAPNGVIGGMWVATLHMQAMAECWSILHNARWTTSLHLPFTPWPLLDWSIATREHIATLPNICASTNELYMSIATVLLGKIVYETLFPSHPEWNKGEQHGEELTSDALAA